MRILLIEDEVILLDGIQAGLRLSGNIVDAVDNCADGYAAMSSSTFDAVILDVMLPDGSGLDLLARVRAEGNETPVLLLTALDEIKDRVNGLDRGADDHLGKPFDLEELGARLRAIVRRKAGRTKPNLLHGQIILNPASLEVIVGDKLIHLSRREFAVLASLMERPGTIRSKNFLEEQLYGWQEEVESNAVEVHIHNLRSKIGRDAIETVRGAGYRMRTPTP